MRYAAQVIMVRTPDTLRQATPLVNCSLEASDLLIGLRRELDRIRQTHPIAACKPCMKIDFVVRALGKGGNLLKEGSHL